MARTLAQIQEQIEKLNQIAGKLKAREVAGVVERIRAAIEQYGLTAEDVFGPKSAPAQSSTATDTRGMNTTVKKSASPIKYRDGHGNTWTGHGQRPRWFKEALAGGKTSAELEVNSRGKRTAAKKSASPIKYRDDQSNAWTGNGQRPRWFKEALASGKTREELHVNS